MLTKDGYFMSPDYGTFIYERIKGNNFYNYVLLDEPCFKQETSFDLENRYTS